MARYRPLEISTQLCYLFDSKVATVDEFASTLKLTPQYIERLTNNPRTPIDGVTRLDVVRLLGHYHRRFPETRPPSEYEFAQHQLRLVDEADSEDRKGTPRGVGEEPDAPPGVRVFRSVDSSGKFVERREYVAAHVSRQIERRILLGMEAYLDAVDPVSESVSGDT